MNAPIVRVFGVVLALFALLTYFTARWTVIDRSSLQDNPQNKRALLAQAKIARGTIYAADGATLARSVRLADGTYTRRYPRHGLFAQALGYAYLIPGTSGLEQYYNGTLIGRSNGLENTLRRLQGKGGQGNDLRTSLDPAAQQVALQQLAGRPGAVVALDPRTGRIRVMASIPSYDPNALRTEKATSALNRASGAPLLNRNTQGLYPPGSTMKVVTSIAAIDTGTYTPNSVVNGKNGIEISGVPLNNDGNVDWGNIDLTTALTHSVNTVFAQVGERLGKARMQRYMDRLGFEKPVQVDLPLGQRYPSGTYCVRGGTLRLVEPTADCVDIGRVAIGQSKLLVTPLQMAMVAAAVANGGTLMTPYIATRAIDPDGRTVLSNEPKVFSHVMSRSTADQVTAMMQRVVQEGTGTAAALQGINVAGKTGTAEKGAPGSNITQPWFIAFAPADAPRIAIAVTIEKTIGGFGGTDAAPIAKAVMESLLQ
ncbi:MAG TPA: penicillin-binding transpeptidase domain-containing protein [Solirubrobacteraceae bacterium]|nr:penicillin-binding transpeptidase domain-containing protein [Solirubrobacteraceae bacterium]